MKVELGQHCISEMYDATPQPRGLSLRISKYVAILPHAEPTFSNSMTSPAPHSENNYGLDCAVKTGPIIQKKVLFSQ